MVLLVQIPAAIETCVTLNHWHDAVELAKKYNQPTQVGRNIIVFEPLCTFVFKMSIIDSLLPVILTVKKLFGCVLYFYSLLNIFIQIKKVQVY